MSDKRTFEVPVHATYSGISSRVQVSLPREAWADDAPAMADPCQPVTRTEKEDV